MMLGGAVFSDDLLLEGLDTSPPLEFTKRRYICGGLNVQVSPNDGGRILTLVAARIGNDVYGYFTQAQVDILNAMWQAGVAVELVHHRGTFSVLIEDVAVEPRVGVADPDADAMYVGRVSMIEM